MKQYLVFIILSVFQMRAVGQSVNILLNNTAASQFASRDVLNFHVTNQSANSFFSKFKFVISDQKLGPVSEIITETIKIPIGISSFTPSTLKPELVRYLNAAYAEIERNSNSLPSGSYIICAELICVDPICVQINPENSFKTCIESVIETPTPLILTLPADKDSIDELRPFFTWIPPMPLGNSPEIYYNVSLYPVNPKQSLPDAISRNRAIFKQELVYGNNLPFPNGIESLVKGKTYTWQVEAVYKGIKVATSEVWEFVIRNPKKMVDTVRYAVPQTKVGAGYILIKENKVLYFSHKGSYANEELLVTLNSDRGNKVKLVPGQVLKVNAQRPGENEYSLKSFGDNKYMLDFSNLHLSPGFYILKIKSANYKESYLKIKIEE